MTDFIISVEIAKVEKVLIDQHYDSEVSTAFIETFILRKQDNLS